MFAKADFPFRGPPLIRWKKKIHSYFCGVGEKTREEIVQVCLGSRKSTYDVPRAPPSGRVTPPPWRRRGSGQLTPPPKSPLPLAASHPISLILTAAA